MTAILLLFGIVACGDRIEEPPTVGETQPALIERGLQISEVSPPEEIQKLRLVLEQYQPQVTILSPQPDEVLEDTTVAVRLQVRDLPLFKNQEFDLGPHLHVILDNEPYRAVYDVSEPIVFEDLTPGTHTLRVFASRPWHESFKNEGAYAQTTFHLFAKTDDNRPDPDKPLLTYSRPKGSYGAEPIMLDFYLTNAPLHFVARENPEDAIADWRIRVTIDGESFAIDRWEPIYLKGFNRGTHWVQLEFLDEQGNPVNNSFNNTVRLISYEPRGKDSLSRLVRGDLKAKEAIAIVDPNYNPPPAPPEPEPTPAPIELKPEPESLLPIPEPEEMPVEVVPEDFMTAPEEVQPEPVEQPAPLVPEEVQPEPVEEPAPLVPEEVQPEPEVVEPLPEVVEPQPEAVESLPEVVEPQSEVVEPLPKVVEPQPEAKPAPTKVEKSALERLRERFRRFRQPAIAPELSEGSVEEKAAPVIEPVLGSEEDVTPQPVE